MTEVSIPHRYGKNFLAQHNSKKAMYVSIPHRYGKNAIDEEIRPVYEKVSIPHRYGKNKKRFYIFQC